MAICSSADGNSFHDVRGISSGSGIASPVYYPQVQTGTDNCQSRFTVFTGSVAFACRILTALRSTGAPSGLFRLGRDPNSADTYSTQQLQTDPCVTPRQHMPKRSATPPKKVSDRQWARLLQSCIPNSLEIALGCCDPAPGLPPKSLFTDFPEDEYDGFDVHTWIEIGYPCGFPSRDLFGAAWETSLCP